MELLCRKCRPTDEPFLTTATSTAMVDNKVVKCSQQTNGTSYSMCWNMWKSRCTCKYGGKTTNISTVKYAVHKDNFKMLNSAFPHLQCPAKWTDLIPKSEKRMQDIKVNMMKWF